MFQAVDLKVGWNAYLEYLMEPTILFPRSSLQSRIKVSVDKGGCGAYAGILVDDPLALDHALWRFAAARRKLATGKAMPPRRK